MEMKRQDLEELSQLLMMYAGCYGGTTVKELQQEVYERYRNCYDGENIFEKRNPRKAGRKKQYTEEDKNKIRELRRKGIPIREIAKETGCSVGYIQGIIRGS